jgi:hypothetical protein
MSYTNIISSDIFKNSKSIDDLEFFKNILVKEQNLKDFGDIQYLRYSIIKNFEKSIVDIKKRFGRDPDDPFIYHINLDLIPLDEKRDSEIDVLFNKKNSIDIFTVTIYYKFDVREKLNYLSFNI